MKVSFEQKISFSDSLQLHLLKSKKDSENNLIRRITFIYFGGVLSEKSYFCSALFVFINP